MCVIQPVDEGIDAAPDEVPCVATPQKSSEKYKKYNNVNGNYHQKINHASDSCYKLQHDKALKHSCTCHKLEETVDTSNISSAPTIKSIPYKIKSRNVDVKCKSSTELEINRPEIREKCENLTKSVITHINEYNQMWKEMNI